MNKLKQRNFWLSVFAIYALTEAVIQLLYLIILNRFTDNRISIIEYHFIMWGFQCLFILPIWWVAKLVYKQSVLIQLLVNAVFFIAYNVVWFGPVQDAILFLYNHLQEITRPVTDRQQAYLDRGDGYFYVRYQLLKHAFRLSWFYVASFFYNYHREEKQHIALATANNELQLKTLKWRLNPAFYFRTIHYLQQVAQQMPLNAVQPILQLSRTMEYVIYEAKEKLIAVKKELLFLENYIELLNKQDENDCRFALTVQGNYNNLTIAPLLLNALLDGLTEYKKENEQVQYHINLAFEMNKMQITISKENNTPILLSPDATVLKQLRELYHGKFTYNPVPGNNLPQMIIMLDEN